MKAEPPSVLPMRDNSICAKLLIVVRSACNCWPFIDPPAIASARSATAASNFSSTGFNAPMVVSGLIVVVSDVLSS